MIHLLALARAALALAGVVLSLGYHLAYAGRTGGRRTLYVACLVVAAAASLYTYFEIGPPLDRTRVDRIINPHDFYHYYLGAKYHAELGYFKLYECSLVADAQGRRLARPGTKARDLRTHALRPITEVRAAGRDCRKRFTEARWAAFHDDVHWLTGRMSATTFLQILRDKGYNATPIWTALLSPLVQVLPLDSTAALAAVLGLDLLWATVLFVAIGRTYGRVACLLSMLFWGANFMASTYFVKGSFSRLDWLACLVLALCLLRRERHVAAGVFAGLAAGLRVFPILFFAGLLFKGLRQAWSRRAVPAGPLRFFSALAVTLGLLVGVTSLTAAGRQDWSDFATKIRAHDQQMAGYRVGLKYAVVHADPATSGLELMRDARTARRATWIGGVLVAGLLLAGAPRWRDDETVGFSFVLVFVLTAPTFYYYQMLIVPFLLFRPVADRTRFAFGMALLFGWCALGHMMQRIWRPGPDLSYWMSWSLIGVCLLLLAFAFSIDRRQEEESPEPLAA